MCAYLTAAGRPMHLRIISSSNVTLTCRMTLFLLKTVRFAEITGKFVITVQGRMLLKKIIIRPIHTRLEKNRKNLHTHTHTHMLCIIHAPVYSPYYLHPLFHFHFLFFFLRPTLPRPPLLLIAATYLCNARAAAVLPQ